jgi:hypothetical protein
MLLLKDAIFNKVHTNKTQVSSGSLAEGLDLPGSDIDIMFVLNEVQVKQNVQHMHRSARYSTTLLMKDSMEFPGFTRLLKVDSDHGNTYSPPVCVVRNRNDNIVSNYWFLSNRY